MSEVAATSRGRDWIGKPVLDAATGVTLGEIEDLLIDPARLQLIGVRLNGAGRRWVAPLQGVMQAGTGALLADSALLKPVQTGPGAGSLQQLLGKVMLARSGADLGVLDDLSFDERSGAITGYITSGGPIADLLEGRSVIQPAALVQGDHAVLLADTPAWQ